MKATNIDEFLRPLRLDTLTAHRLARELCTTFKRLAAESHDQFLPTPVTETILRPPAGDERGRYLAIDIGGTNLRVGFIELLGRGNTADATTVNGCGGAVPPVRLRRHLERSWPIQDLLKNENADHLFSWIGSCIAEVVDVGCQEFRLPRHEPLSLGVTFSFPMVQHTLSEATLMAMGKGFAITTDVDLASQLSRGYETARKPDLPPIKIAAIANDAVATLVSFVYQAPEGASCKAAMGLICGTGSNATIPLPVSMLKPSKLPQIQPGQGSEDPKVAVNTEWSINGTASALRSFDLVSKWDEQLDAAGEVPGFQPLEYMTAGRYLGELGRIILLDYLAGCGYRTDALPEKLRNKFGLATTFLSHFKPLNAPVLLGRLEAEFPAAATDSSFAWTEEMASVVYSIAKAIEVRAAGIIAAATVGLLACAGDICLQEDQHPGANGQAGGQAGAPPPMDLVVGFTGGCIAHFQDYLSDCRGFLQGILEAEFGSTPPVRISLHPCHDGGITGAGVLSGASRASAEHVQEA